MPVLRFSACRPGAMGQQIANFTLFAEDEPGQLDCDARSARRLDDIYRQSGDLPFHEQPIFADDSALARFAETIPEAGLGAADQPVIVFVHGFQFDVRQPPPPRPEVMNHVARTQTSNPHRQIFHCDETLGPAHEHADHTTPWLARAFFDSGSGAEADLRGLAVCYGYDGTGDTQTEEQPGLLDTLDAVFDFVTPTGDAMNFYALAYLDAMIAGHGLAAVISRIARRLEAAGQPQRPIHVVCHSLGTRTALKALEVLAMRYPQDRTLDRIGKVLLLAGACLWHQAGKTLDRIVQADPERRPEFFNVFSREDGVVRVLGSRAALRIARREAGFDPDGASALGAFFSGAPLIGREGKPDGTYTGGKTYPDWADLDLDLPSVQDWGKARDLDLRGDLGRGKPDHWIHFTHKPNWELYRRMLRGADGYGARDLAASVPRKP